MSDRAVVDSFLAGRRIALVGVSSHPRDFSRIVMKELVAHGYDIVPVRPGGGEIEGRPIHARLQDVPGRLDGALLMTPPAVTAQVVRDAAEAGVGKVWMHRGFGRGSVDDEAVAFCRARGIEVVAGECPLMFVGRGAVHRVHAGARCIAGHYPRARTKEEPRRRAAVALVAHGVVAWLVTVMNAAMLDTFVSRPLALAIYLVTAGPILAMVATHLARRHDWPSILVPSAVLTGIVVLLDLVFAWLVLGSLALFADPVATWIPFALMFAGSLVGMARVLTPVTAR